MTGIKTNLIINTNKRTYNFFLHAAPKAMIGITPMVSFKYPYYDKNVQVKANLKQSDKTHN